MKNRRANCTCPGRVGGELHGGGKMPNGNKKTWNHGTKKKVHVTKRKNGGKNVVPAELALEGRITKRETGEPELITLHFVGGGKVWKRGKLEDSKKKSSLAGGEGWVPKRGPSQEASCHSLGVKKSSCPGWKGEGDRKKI